MLYRMRVAGDLTQQVHLGSQGRSSPHSSSRRTGNTRRINSLLEILAAYLAIGFDVQRRLAMSHQAIAAGAVVPPVAPSAKRGTIAMLNNNKKECSTFELDLTLNNLANMARFKGQQVSCECAVLPTKRVLQVE